MRIKSRIRRLEDVLGREDGRPKILHHTPEEQAILKEIAVRYMKMVVERGSADLPRLDKESEIKLLRELAAQVMAEKGIEDPSSFPPEGM